MVIKISKKLRVGMIVAGFALVVGYLPFGLYLNVLTWAVSNAKVSDYAGDYLV